MEALKGRMKNLRRIVQYSNNPVPRCRPTPKSRLVKFTYHMPAPPPLGLPLKQQDRPRHDGLVEELQKEYKSGMPIKQVNQILLMSLSLSTTAH